MAKISRRNFLKAAAATAAVSGFYIYPDREALAASNAPEVVKYSHCAMCNHGPKCGIKAIVKDGKIYRVEKREGYNNNLLCAKGISSLQELYEPNRLLHPVKRTTPKGSADPKWERISWDEALATIAEKLNATKAKYGAESVLFMTGDPKEPRSALQRLAYTFGSPNMGTESSTCYKATELATKLIYGYEWYNATEISCGVPPTPGKTKVCIIWGNNPAWSQPFSYDRLKKVQEGGTVKYIVVDPRATPTVHAFADVHLQVRPGTDGALALGFANILISQGKYDKEFVKNWTHGFKEYAEYVKEFTPEKVSEITGVSIDLIVKAGQILADAGGPICIKSSAAFPHHTNGTNNYRAMMSLIPLTGSYDVPGGPCAPNEPLQFDEWGGTQEFAKLTGFLKENFDKRCDKDYFPVWAELDNEGSLQINPIPEYVKTGKIRSCLMLGGNTMMWPQSQEYQKAFEDMDFAVAADFYIRPWTHNHMDMVLPAAMSFESMAPLTVFGRKIFLREPVVQPAGEARSDWRICCDIGVAMGYKDEFWGGGEEAVEECLREVLRTLNANVTLEDLRAAMPDGVVVPLKNGPKFKKYELGLLRPDGKPGFTTPTGKIEFTSEVLRKHNMNPLPIYKEPVYSPISTPEVAKQYPLILMTGSRVPYYTHSKERDLPWLNQFMPEPIICLHPDDAKARGINEGDMVVLSSPLGEIKLKAKYTNIVLPGCVDLIHGWEKANVNLLISRDFDPISGFPPFKEGLCQVRKA